MILLVLTLFFLGVERTMNRRAFFIAVAALAAHGPRRRGVTIRGVPILWRPTLTEVEVEVLPTVYATKKPRTGNEPFVIDWIRSGVRNG